eukprot:2087143-Prymnesium_polylepis.1
MPPFSSGPWSSVARNASQLGRLSLGGAPLYTQAYRWSSFGFERRATTSVGASVRTTVRLPLSTAGVLMTGLVSGGRAVRVELRPQVRAYPASQINCSKRQWRYPSDMASSPCVTGSGYCERNCWNWYAPRPFANESAAFHQQDARSGDVPQDQVTVLTFVDTLSGALTAVAATSNRPFRRHGAALEWAERAERAGGDGTSGPTELGISVAIAFGMASDEEAVVATAVGWARDMPRAMAEALEDREERFKDVFTGSGRYSGRLPVLKTLDEQVRSVYYSGVA